MPTCAVCNKEVDRLEVRELILEQGKEFTAYCHGEAEVQFMPYEFLVDYGGKIGRGTAFQRNRIEHAKD